ncbi:Endonuclease III [hydrothermal vent metagenome]|uniref:Endonuclease III n=1 Tax=hydrothermal vent metagenome TaxID=652676 RepID=A0A3B1CPA3_9ZZZZ
MNAKNPSGKKAHNAAVILKCLEAAIPEPEVALTHKNPFQLLIATILSAQCTDVRVNQVTPKLFETFPGPEDMIKGEPDVLISLIRTTGFFNNKAKNIIACSLKLVTDFDGKVPQTLAELITLAGVGRKTANVVLGEAFGQQTIVVDTHVRRVSNRLGLSQSNDPVQIEKDLQKRLPQNKWTASAHRLLLHGRHVCKSRKPLCDKCVVVDLCPWVTKN